MAENTQSLRTKELKRAWYQRSKNKENAPPKIQQPSLISKLIAQLKKFGRKITIENVRMILNTDEEFVRDVELQQKFQDRKFLMNCIYKPLRRAQLKQDKESAQEKEVPLDQSANVVDEPSVSIGCYDDSIDLDESGYQADTCNLPQGKSRRKLKEEEKAKAAEPKKYGYSYEWNDEINDWKRVHRKIVPKPPQQKRQEDESEEEILKISFPRVADIESALGMKIQFIIQPHESIKGDTSADRHVLQSYQWYYGLLAPGYVYKSVRVSKISPEMQKDVQVLDSMSSSPFFLRIERREQIRDFHVIVTDPVVLNLEQLLVNDLYRWDLNTITLIFYNICLLINDLHAKNYVYSNLIAKNILFSPNMQPYLTDMYKVVEAELNQVKVPKPPENHQEICNDDAASATTGLVQLCQHSDTREKTLEVVPQDTNLLLKEELKSLGGLLIYQLFGNNAGYFTDKYDRPSFDRHLPIARGNSTTIAEMTIFANTLRDVNKDMTLDQVLGHKLLKNARMTMNRQRSVKTQANLDKLVCIEDRCQFAYLRSDYEVKATQSFVHPMKHFKNDLYDM